MTRMKLSVLSALVVSVFASGQAQEKSVMVGGAAMYPSRTIVENAMNSKDHTTLVAAVKAAGLVDTLQGKGPFTVFAPTNAAFDELPSGTVETLLKSDNKDTLKGILTYHVVPGNHDARALREKAKAGNGKAKLSTVSGGTLWVVDEGGTLTVRDEKGGTARITTADVRQSNGVIHVVSNVLMPE